LEYVRTVRRVEGSGTIDAMVRNQDHAKAAPREHDLAFIGVYDAYKHHDRDPAAALEIWAFSGGLHA